MTGNNINVGAMIRSARDWVLKRFLKFLLHKSLGRYLRTDLDLEQLDLKLDAGSVALKGLLIDCAAVNKDAVRGWTVACMGLGCLHKVHLDAAQAGLHSPAET